MKIFKLLVFVCWSATVQAQVHEIINLSELFPAPNNEAPRKKDISASLKGFVTPDSIIFEIQVQDNKVLNGSGVENSDHVEIWFGFHESDFSDFIVADTRDRKPSRIFRNSIESGDNADLERFLKLGDYPPNAKVQDGATLEWLNADVPLPDKLRRETVFYGISSFACFADNRQPIQTNREKYKYMEDQLFPFDDLSKALVSRSELTSNGYKIRVALHNTCLVFAEPVTMNDFRFAVQVHDTDGKGESTTKFISSAKNNYYARPFYFNKASFPFPLNIHLPGVPDGLIQKMGLKFSMIRSGGTWKPYYYSNGPIIYAPDIMSDAGLAEYEFYPANINFTESAAGADVAWNRLDIEYDDISAFYQHEIYYTVGDSVALSSKSYRYNEEEPGDFVNSIFKLKDGSAAAVLYDYEPVDPFGWGQYGMTADEFVYIQKLDKKSGYPIFNVGQRVEATGVVAVGDPLLVKLEQVKKITYRWIKFGETFEMQVDSDSPDFKRTLQFQIGADNKVTLIK